jgi:hypothetical protein
MKKSSKIVIISISSIFIIGQYFLIGFLGFFIGRSFERKKLDLKGVVAGESTQRNIIRNKIRIRDRLYKSTLKGKRGLEEIKDNILTGEVTDIQKGNETWITISTYNNQEIWKVRITNDTQINMGDLNALIDDIQNGDKMLAFGTKITDQKIIYADLVNIER